MISDGPVELPGRWVKLVDKAVGMSGNERDLIEMCVKRGRPMGDDEWTRGTAVKLGLESTLRPTGRPKKSV